MRLMNAPDSRRRLTRMPRSNSKRRRSKAFLAELRRQCRLANKAGRGERAAAAIGRNGGQGLDRAAFSRLAETVWPAQRFRSRAGRGGAAFLARSVGSPPLRKPVQELLKRRAALEVLEQAVR